MNLRQKNGEELLGHVVFLHPSHHLADAMHVYFFEDGLRHAFYRFLCNAHQSRNFLIHEIVLKQQHGLPFSRSKMNDGFD